METRNLGTIDEVCATIVERLNTTKSVVEIFRGSKLPAQNQYHYLIAAKTEWLQQFSPDDRVEVAGSPICHDIAGGMWGFPAFTAYIKYKGWAFATDMHYNQPGWYESEGWVFRAVQENPSKLEKQISDAINFKRKYPLQIGASTFEAPQTSKRIRKILTKKQ